LNLVHKDLKPDNFLIVDDNPEGALLGLIDFAYCVNADEMTDDKRGTPIYAPPEKCGNEFIDPEKFDIFMLGCLFLTIIFRAPPFLYETEKKEWVTCFCLNDKLY
jgi:serine/threonine protein kinase